MSDVSTIILRSGAEASADLAVMGLGYASNTNVLLVGTGNPETIIRVPTNRTTGNFEFAENFNVTRIKISGGQINGTPIGADIPDSGNFSNLILEWYDDEGEQSASNDPIQQWRSSSVNHELAYEGIDASTYGFVERYNADDGGLKINGVTSAVTAIDIAGWAETSTVPSTKTAASRSVVEFTAYGAVSGEQAAITGNSNAFGWYSSTEEGKIAVGFLTADGDLHLDGSATIQLFDDWDDVKLVSGLRGMMIPPGQEGDLLRDQFSDMIAYAREPMERHGIISVDPETGKVYLNMKRAMFLVFDALRQVGDRLTVAEDKADTALDLALAK